MNVLTARRLLIGIAALIVAGIVGNLAVYAFRPPGNRINGLRKQKVIDPLPPGEVFENKGVLDESDVSDIHIHRESLFTTVERPKAFAKPNWGLVRLESVTQWKGKWSAVITIQKTSGSSSMIRGGSGRRARGTFRAGKGGLLRVGDSFPLPMIWDRSMKNVQQPARNQTVQVTILEIGKDRNKKGWINLEDEHGNTNTRVQGAK